VTHIRNQRSLLRHRSLALACCLCDLALCLAPSACLHALGSVVAHLTSSSSLLLVLRFGLQLFAPPAPPHRLLAYISVRPSSSTCLPVWWFCSV